MRFHEFGGLEKLRFEEAPEPHISPTEVLVRVRACALNHLDIWARGGTRSERIPLPHISGSDVSGEVTELGNLVSGHSKDEKVLIAPGINCGICDYCSNGWDSLCDSYKIIGYETQGGYAEYVAVPATNILPIPDKLTFEEASSVPLVFLTAWHMLVTRAHLAPGETALVWAAGSGVGSAAVQVAKLLGAKVIATIGSDMKREKAQKLGADFVLNHRWARRTPQSPQLFRRWKTQACGRLRLPTHGSCEGSGENGEERALRKDSPQSVMGKQ